MNTAHELAHALDGKRVADGRYTARCPSHDDKSPSLSISDGRKGVVFYCHVGCSQREVMGALKDRGLWADERKQFESPPVC